VIREKSLNGEIHFILPESKSDENKKNAENFDEAEIRKLMKKEAAKPLLLLREE
jgi:chemotaxis receptor (MCP) glutamine deamidase CheD